MRNKTLKLLFCVLNTAANTLLDQVAQRTVSIINPGGNSASVYSSCFKGRPGDDINM